MASPTQKVKLGLFLIGGAALFAALLVLFAGLSFWRPVNTYYVRVPESVSGIESGSYVNVQGVPVGEVGDIELFPDQQSVVQLALELEKETRVYRDAKAYLTFKGVTGLKEVNIEGGSPEAGILEPGGHIQYGETTLDKLSNRADELMDTASKLIQSTDRLVRQLTELASELDFQRVGSILQRTDGMVAELEAASRQLNGMVTENRAPLRDTVRAAQASLERIEALADGAEGVVSNLDGTVSEVRTVVRLNEDQVRATLQNLRDATQSFRHLGRELRRKPSRLLFSDAPPERKLP